ncbi:hypothetical protein [Microbacterium sp. 4R-513]|uniref:hypothetical protein n=1 Tax=Microbacterium sp. 4R-513 TaxID=2567934 RepID=UPI00321ACE0E
MARLTRVRPGQDPGIRRVRAGSGFRYIAPDGTAASDDDRERIHELVIPPAWEDVWISADPLGHIQAVGTDDAGRRQYLYHPRWRERRDRGKYARALDLAQALPSARRRVTTALRSEGLSRQKVLAVSFRLLDEGAPRIGSARYLERHGSRGAHDAAETGCLGRGIRRHPVVPRQERAACLHRDRRRRARARHRRAACGQAGSPPALVPPAAVVA